MRKKGLWIAVSGLDGSGKTTLVDNLESFFGEKGLSVYRDRLPHDQYLVKKMLDESKDSYTDRVLFALDNRIFGTKLSEMQRNEEYDIYLTQRCFLDSFVHGAVQGYTYEWIESLNQVADLPRTDVIIHLVAEANVAYQRICNDPEADKFEYPAYIKKQEIETRRAFAEVVKKDDPALSSFRDCINIYVDTTQMTQNEVFEFVKHKLEKLEIL